MCSPRYQNQCCVSNISDWSLPHFSLFPSFDVPSSKAPNWLSCSGGPRGLTFDLSFSKASRFHFFRLTFWLLSPLSFFPNGLIPFYKAERSPPAFLHGPSFWVPWGTKPLLISCWFSSLLILFCIIGWLMGHIYPYSRVSRHALLNCLSPNLALLHIPRILSSWKSPGILVQFSPQAPQRFSYLWRLGWASSFLCFVRSKACLSIGLGPFLWTLNGFGPPPFESPNFFLDFNPLRCFGLRYNIVIFLDLNRYCLFLDLLKHNWINLGI